MSHELDHDHGELLVEPITLEDGRVLTVTEAPDGKVHIHFGEFGTTFPKFIIKGNGNGDFSAGLAETTQQLEKTLRAIRII